jgi:F-type H+-transporting ATPase subunit gamma
VLTAERGLCGGFNSSIAKLAKNHADKLAAEGKTVKILTVGKKGRDAAQARLFGVFRRSRRSERGQATSAMTMRRRSPATCSPLRRGRVRRGDDLLRTASKRDQPDPDAQQVIPAKFDEVDRSSDRHGV